MHLPRSPRTATARALQRFLRASFTLWLCLVPLLGALHFGSVGHDALDECLEAPGDTCGHPGTATSPEPDCPVGPRLAPPPAAPADGHAPCPLAWRIAPHPVGPAPVTLAPHECLRPLRRSPRPMAGVHRSIPLLSLAPKNSPPAA